MARPVPCDPIFEQSSKGIGDRHRYACSQNQCQSPHPFQPENECEAGNSGPDKILLDGNELHEFQEYSGLKMRVDPVE